VRLGVISDTHGSVTAWRVALEQCFPDAELIVHAGDLLYHGPRNPIPEGYDPAALAEAINQAPAPVIVVRGNCDSDVDQLAINWPIQAPYALVQQGALRIMVTHGDGISAQRAAELIEAYRLDVLVSGHTHHPVAERARGRLLLNPGSPSLPKWEWHGQAVPTAAALDDDGARICDIRSGETLIEQPLR
jgi:putative phosphoesterase